MRIKSEALYGFDIFSRSSAVIAGQGLFETCLDGACECRSAENVIER